jgi:hypothetical protein
MPRNPKEREVMSPRNKESLGILNGQLKDG